jgi:hypothetical protein
VCCFVLCTSNAPFLTLAIRYPSSPLRSRCLVYICVMRSLIKSKPDALGDIGGLMKKFKGLPRAVLLDLSEKFTETSRGAAKCVSFRRRFFARTPDKNLLAEPFSPFSLQAEDDA